jgi:hypothetical protein
VSTSSWVEVSECKMENVAVNDRSFFSLSSTPLSFSLTDSNLSSIVGETGTSAVLNVMYGGSDGEKECVVRNVSVGECKVCGSVKGGGLFVQSGVGGGES